MWLNRREDSVHRKRKRELQNVRTEYKQVSTRREHLVVSIIFEWEWKCRIYRTLKWLGGFVCRPASRAEVDNAVWAGMREREGREGERESEREKHLMTQGRWAPLEKQEYIYRQQKKQNSWCITYYNRVFFFFNEMVKVKVQWQPMNRSDSSSLGREILHHWVPMIMVCLFFFRVLSPYKSSKWQYPSTIIFFFTFYSMSYFTRVLVLVVEMLQAVFIYVIGTKYIPGYSRRYAVHPYI